MKELRELLTPTTIVPIVAMALVFAYMGTLLGGVEQEAQAKPVLGVVDLDQGVLGNVSMAVLRAGSQVEYTGTNVTEGLLAVEPKGGTAVVLLPANFTETILSGHPGRVEVFWIMRGAGILDSVSSGAVDGLLASVDRAISSYLIETSASVDPGVVLAPTAQTETTYFHEMILQGVSPGVLSQVLSSQSIVVPLVIMMIIIMAGSMVISSMGMEKENKTLETLLTLPVRRSSIVAGKIIASALVGLLMAGIYMVGFDVYMGSLSGSSELSLAAYGLVVSPLDYVLVGVSVFAALFAALALCMVIGTFAKNYKAAQTLTMPVTLLAMIPMFITMFKDFDTLPPVLQAIVFAIPFSHPMMAMRSLMFGNYAFVLAGIAYALAFAIAMIFLAVWIFNTDRLLTGRLARPAARRRIWGLVRRARGPRHANRRTG